ncbi:hypothetical protein IAT40_006579 [Kwoniella sp. CBS 6097]
MDLGAPISEHTKAVPPSGSPTTTTTSTSTLVDRDISAVPPSAAGTTGIDTDTHKGIDGAHPHGVPPPAQPVPVPAGVMDGPPPEPVPPAVGGAGPRVPAQQNVAADPSLNQLPNPNLNGNDVNANANVHSTNANARATIDTSNTDHPIAQAVLHERPHDTAVPSVPSTATSASDPSKGTTQPADHPSHPQAQAPTASIDPHKPSSESAPTALPTNAATHPEEQKRAIQDEHPAVVGREIEKTKAEARELKGEAPKGTVVHGLEDDRLWAMLRRFDVQITHVLHPATGLPPKEPDLRPSTLPNLPSHSDVLRSNLERVFAAVGPSSIRGAREMQRLMSWAPEERWRTGTYCAAYFTCWIFGYAIAGVCSFLIALICFPECRRYLFPPVAPAPFTPPSATDPTNQKGDESLLGNVDGKTVHRSKAEQAEEQAFEATSILQAYTTRLLFDGRKKGKEAGNSNVGEKKGESSSSSSDIDDDVPPGQPGVNRTAKQDQSQGLESGTVVVGGEKITPEKPLNEKEKKKLAQREAKRKRDEMVSKMTKATEEGLGAFADTIERFTNALSPPLPYPDSYARFKMAGAFVVPIMFLFTFVPPWIFARSATFFFGVGMWGQPLLIRGAEKFVELVPNWQELLDMRNSILSGVPTDAQLTLHLLRVAEALNAPLPRPPAPPLKGTPKEAIKDTTPATVTAEDDAEVLQAEEEGGLTEVATKAKHKTKSHILGAFKAAGKKMAGIGGDVAVDGTKKQARINETDTSESEKGGDLTTKEKIGSKVDKLFFKGHIKDTGGEESYPCKLDGTSGHLILENRSDIIKEPRITFVPVSGKSEHFVLPIDDIVEIKKSHVSMPRMALGWASGAEVEGLGLTVRFKPVAQQIKEAQGGKKHEGKTLHFTRVGRREQLFVRLVSMGVQRWEVL